MLSSDLESRVPDLYNVTVNSLRKDDHHHLGFLLLVQGLGIRIRLVWSDPGLGCLVGSGSFLGKKAESRSIFGKRLSPDSFLEKVGFGSVFLSFVMSYLFRIRVELIRIRPSSKIGSGSDLRNITQ